MEISEQLDEWLKGNSMHNEERDECVPDFSCCGGKSAPLDAKKRFVKAYHDDNNSVIHEMLMMFLRSLLKEKDLNEDVHIAGDKANHELEQ